MRPLPAVASIVVLDDHPLVREGLAARISLEPDLILVGAADSEEEAVALVKEHAPDLLIVDLLLKKGNGSGFEVIKRVKAMRAPTRCLVFSALDEAGNAERALRAGAAGFLHKQEATEKLITAIRAVLRGERFISEFLMSRLVGQALNDRDEAGSPEELLTSRELEIFRLIGSGETSGAIAARLHISSHTIDSHRENIKRKLGVKHAGQLVKAAVEWVVAEK